MLEIGFEKYFENRSLFWPKTLKTSFNFYKNCSDDDDESLCQK